MAPLAFEGVRFAIFCHGGTEVSLLLDSKRNRSSSGVESAIFIIHYLNDSQNLFAAYPSEVWFCEAVLVYFFFHYTVARAICFKLTGFPSLRWDGPVEDVLILQSSWFRNSSFPFGSWPEEFSSSGISQGV